MHINLKGAVITSQQQINTQKNLKCYIFTAASGDTVSIEHDVFSKRSITSLSLFNNSKKDEEQPANNSINNNKDRKNSFGRLRAARSSLDLSSLGFGSISRASSKSALTELKEENDNINNTNKEKPQNNLSLKCYPGHH